MNSPSRRALTLIELLMAMVIFCMVIFGFYNIQLFSHSQVVASSRRATLQGEVIYVIEHMSKRLRNTIGDVAAYPVDFGPDGHTVRFWSDTVADGRFIAGQDRRSYYRHVDPGTVYFCPDDSASPVAEELLASHIISNFDASSITINTATNYVGINLKACWNPSNPSSCGSPDNPAVTFNSRVEMPSVSTSP